MKAEIFCFQESLDLWIKRGVDGFLLNDLSKITSTAEKVAEVAWTKLNPSKALFLDASDPTLSVKLSEVYSIANGSIGVPNPVVLHRTPTKGVDFKQQVLQITNKTRNFPAFIVSLFLSIKIDHLLVTIETGNCYQRL